MSYGDYVEQLTYLLFLKMADERSKPPYLLASGLSACEAQAGAGNRPSPIPKEYNWQNLLKKDDDGLFDYHRHLLEELELGKESGLLGLLFGRAKNADTCRC